MPEPKGVFCGDKRMLTALVLFSPLIILVGLVLMAWDYGFGPQSSS